mgnify:CR=1 FL=1
MHRGKVAAHTMANRDRRRVLDRGDGRGAAVDGLPGRHGVCGTRHGRGRRMHRGGVRWRRGLGLLGQADELCGVERFVEFSYVD